MRRECQRRARAPPATLPEDPGARPRRLADTLGSGADHQCSAMSIFAKKKTGPPAQATLRRRLPSPWAVIGAPACTAGPVIGRKSFFLVKILKKRQGYRARRKSGERELNLALILSKTR